MNSESTEEKKINSNKTQNLNIKKIKINCYQNLSSNIQSKKNISSLNKNKKIPKAEKMKTRSVDSINLRILNFKYINQNNKKIMQPIRSQLFKTRTINKIDESSKMNNNFNMYKTTIITNYTQKTTQNINESMEHKLLYEDILRLKEKINKLKMEYSFIKSLTRKKDEEIRELERYKEEAKYYYRKKDNYLFFQKLKQLKEIVDLKNKYEEIKIKLRKQKDINNNIMNQIKTLDIAELKKKNEDNLKQLRKKLEEFNLIKKMDEELKKQISETDWVKNKFIENHKYLIQLKIDYNKKKLNIKILQEKAHKLKEKNENINLKKERILRRNSSIKSDNKKLLKERKTRQEYLMKQFEIEKQICSYESKTQNLKNETSEKEQDIDKYSLRKNIEPIFSIHPYLEKNPDNNKEKQITLYESLINESKKKQFEFVEKIMNLIEENDYEIHHKFNKKIRIKSNNYNIDNKNLESFDINMNDNSQIFDENANINSGIKDINIEEKKELLISKNNDIIFVLNVLFYINKIKKEKIKSILLNFKTENYYVASLNEKNSFLMNLSSEILQTINNKKDINNLKDVLLFLLENKYKDNTILFLDEAINDIFILEDKAKIFFNLEKESISLEKLKKMISTKDIKSILNKLRNIKDKIINYENLKSFLNDEKIFNFQDNNENIKYFQFFIYILKKKEIKLTKNYSLKEFNVKTIVELMDELKLKEKTMDNDKNFIVALKQFLKDKNITLENLLEKNDSIEITEFMDILKKNKFKTENISFDLYSALQKYQREENSGNIDINLLNNDLNKI